MASLSRLITAAVVAAGALLTATAVEAAPGKARLTTNVRSGPGTGYAIVDTLAPGARVNVVSCGANWCKVTRVGPDGYVARNRLYNPYYGSHYYYQFPPSTPSAGRDTNNR